VNNRKIIVSAINTAGLLETPYSDKISGDNEILIKTHYSHISSGTELACIAGLESFFQIPGTPGYTAIGEILEKSDNISRFEVGDLVYTYGPHAQYFKINITDRWHGVCVKLPRGIDPISASFTHMAGIAMTALRTSSIELGDDVLVTGLGAIGNLAAQLAQLQGANLIATDISAARITVARACGISNTINNSTENLKDLIEQKTDRRMVSTLIDATGSVKLISEAIKLVGMNGEVILLGSPRAPFETNLTSFMQHFHYLPWCHTLKGALEFTYPTHPVEFAKHSIERNARINLGYILSGKLIVKPLLSHLILPSEIQAAYDGLRNKPDEYYGVVLDWTK